MSSRLALPKKSHVCSKHYKNQGGSKTNTVLFQKHGLKCTTSGTAEALKLPKCSTNLKVNPADIVCEWQHVLHSLSSWEWCWGRVPLNLCNETFPFFLRHSNSHELKRKQKSVKLFGQPLFIQVSQAFTFSLHRNHCKNSTKCKTSLQHQEDAVPESHQSNNCICVQAVTAADYKTSVFIISCNTPSEQLSSFN